MAALSLEAAQVATAKCFIPGLKAGALCGSLPARRAKPARAFRAELEMIVAMKIRPFCFTFALLLFTTVAHAGAWGLRSFDNDDALDWVENELKPSGFRAVERTVARVANSQGYLQSTDGCYAIAACEVLAAMQNHPSPDLPDDIKAIIDTMPPKVSETVRKNGRTALDRVLAKDSELNELWKENKEAYEKWRKAVEDLRSRI